MEIIKKEQEIANIFLNDIAQGDWIVKLDKKDFEEASCHNKPIIVVRAEDDKSIAELATTAFNEITKTGCKPTNFIITLSFRQDDELMMQEMAGFNDCLSTTIDKNTRLKWGVQSLADMPCKRRITIIAFAQDLPTQTKEECQRPESLWKKFSRKLTMRNIAKATAKCLVVFCIYLVCFIGLIYLGRNHNHRFGVWWEKIEAFQTKMP